MLTSKVLTLDFILQLDLYRVRFDWKFYSLNPFYVKIWKHQTNTKMLYFLKVKIYLSNLTKNTQKNSNWKKVLVTFFIALNMFFQKKSNNSFSCTNFISMLVMKSSISTKVSKLQHQNSNHDCLTKVQKVS